MSGRSARRWARRGVGLAALVVGLSALVGWLNVRGEGRTDGASSSPAGPGVVERGAYLAKAGNCAGCHSVPGGAAFAGGRPIETPFGAVYAPNITPDAATGIGTWSASDFWRALHHGRSKDGRLLYPAFPYPSYTNVTRADADALYAFLRSVKPARQESRPHELRFPYRTQAALALWRALFFRPGGLSSEPGRSAEWNRGRYLVQGLGHCGACHSGRNALGATGWKAEFAGALMPGESWYAPSLASPGEAGVQTWPREEVVALLKTGVSAQASVSGPMADVVYAGTRHLSDGDLGAMAAFLASIPMHPEAKPAVAPAPAEVMRRGARLYDAHCASCHGSRGQGVAGIYPALADNRAVTLESPVNLVRMIRQGGFSPSTAGNPRPFGMPPFSQLLSNDDIAAVSTFIRQSWGNRAAEVAPLDALHVR